MSPKIELTFQLLIKETRNLQLKSQFHSSPLPSQIIMKSLTKVLKDDYIVMKRIQ